MLPVWVTETNLAMVGLSFSLDPGFTLTSTLPVWVISSTKSSKVKVPMMEWVLSWIRTSREAEDSYSLSLFLLSEHSDGGGGFPKLAPFGGPTGDCEGPWEK